MFSGSRPDVTPAQIGALLVVLVGQLVAWGWVNNDNAQWIISIGSFVIAAVWKAADAYLRGKRNQTTVPPPSPPR